MWLIACPSTLGRYLILLDKFLTYFAPQEIEALNMPTVEEVRAAVDARGTQWVQRPLATNTGRCCQVMLNLVSVETYMKFVYYGMHRQAFPRAQLPRSPAGA